MTPTSHADLGGYRHPKDRIFSRTQHDAGIAHLQWENRMRPVRSWASILSIGLSAAIVLTAMMAAAGYAFDIWKGLPQ